MGREEDRSMKMNCVICCPLSDALDARKRIENFKNSVWKRVFFKDVTCIIGIKYEVNESLGAVKLPVSFIGPVSKMIPIWRYINGVVLLPTYAMMPLDDEGCALEFN